MEQISSSQDIVGDFSGCGARLTQAANNKRYNAARLGAEFGVSRQVMARKFKGEMLPAHLLFPIADLLGVSARWLVTGQGSPKPPVELDQTTDEEFDLIGGFRLLDPAQRALVASTVATLLGHRVDAIMQKSTQPTLHSPVDSYRAQPKGDRK
jgi:transcriptional regulator with XRE-family HTH domain